MEMRRARFNLEEQVGGLVDRDRYELRRPSAPVEPTSPERSAGTGRPLVIRAARVDDSAAPHAAA